jgi:AcrR family transcriptional regulator
MATVYLDRGELIRVAADVADRDGWMHLTMSSVAKEVDRHVTSLYGHVDGLDGLRREVRLLALDELADALWEAALGRSRDDALVAILDVYRTYLRDHRGRSESLGPTADDDDPEVRRRGERLVEPIYATLRSYGLDDVAVVHGQRALSAIVRGFGASEAAGQYGRPRDADATFAQIRLLFVTALASGTWPAPPA